MPSIITNEASLQNTSVTVAPLVLLSVVDHYERIINKNSDSNFNNSNKRVLGVILGDNYSSKDSIKVTNSFAIPFEEDEKSPDIWFLDHNFIDSMLEMFKKINAKEKLIGWYHSGPKLKQSDLKINELFKKFTSNPLLLIVNVNSNDIIDIPTDSYLAIEEIKDDGTAAEKSFIHLPSIIKAEEAEEIGVEHLLRDIRDQACGNLSIRLTNNFKSLKSLDERLLNIINYLNKILNNELPINNVILGKLQDIFNLLPNLINVLVPSNNQSNDNDIDSNLKNNNNKLLGFNKSDALAKSFITKTNDELMMVYISSLVRSIISFHDLIDNKLENKQRDDENSKKDQDGDIDLEKDEDESSEKKKEEEQREDTDKN
ncbi:hypothetical protein PACTADRAFT_43384 [Pachysolen tannophilus NRRL Y-2460]|uniref:MPN domain-containing protein n=1 Tax=Pachysolen tannophilus NRRL Y-2460 TaxID=669874 RepID=A0A1E4TSG6_PACTA|nr:hypothetical protein PACTADRAFT_43384 [Pachysolen tannophilus NRRL Y-2460]